MTELPLTTPSLLFPAISLLLLAYTNRFLGLASVVRALHSAWKTTREPVLWAQIVSLRRRIQIIKHMQTAGVLSLMLCTISTLLLLLDLQPGGWITFSLSLLLMALSLLLALIEIQMSGRALDLLLQDVECRKE
jgi:hypothetical protein